MVVSGAMIPEHRLPGTIQSSAPVFEHLKARTVSGAFLFGATLLQ